MGIHKEGYQIIIISIVILLLANLLIHFLLRGNRTIQVAGYIISIILLSLILYFFRKPERKAELGEKIVLAPADGKVVAIEEVEETEYFNERRKQVSIFMSPLDVHINWYPVGGTVKYFKYHPGSYLVAWHPKSSTENERTTLVVENENTTILIRQIAGAVARRIVYYSKEGKNVRQGDELGFIKFGSRVDLFLPLDIEINVSLGQHVTGRQTIIAYLN